VQNLGRIRVDDEKLWSNEVFIGFLKGFIQLIDIFNEKGPLQNVRWHGTFKSIKGPLIHISSIFHLYFSHIRIQNQVQKSSPYKSTFRRSRVTLYNHEMGVKFENFDLFEHTSAFKMIIFLRVWGKAACFACFEGLNISVYDISFTIHSYFNQISVRFHPDVIHIPFVFHLYFIYRERRSTKNWTSTPAIPPPFGSWLEL